MSRAGRQRNCIRPAVTGLIVAMGLVGLDGPRTSRAQAQAAERVVEPPPILCQNLYFSSGWGARANGRAIDSAGRVRTLALMSHNSDDLRRLRHRLMAVPTAETLRSIYASPPLDGSPTVPAETMDRIRRLIPEAADGQTERRDPRATDAGVIQYSCYYAVSGPAAPRWADYRHVHLLTHSTVEVEDDPQSGEPARRRRWLSRNTAPSAAELFDLLEPLIGGRH